MNISIVYGFVLVFGISSVAVAAPPYQTMDDHSGEIPPEVKCSQDMMLRWSELDLDRNGQLDRAEIIASAVPAKPIGLRIDSLNEVGPF